MVPAKKRDGLMLIVQTYQEPSIMYLTGVNQNRVILLLDPSSKESDEILFVGEKDPRLEFWDGFRFGVGNPKSVNEVKSVTGIADIRDIDDFDEVLKERLKKQKKKEIGTLWDCRKSRKTRPRFNRRSQLEF